MKEIKWTPLHVDVAKIKETPGNFKLFSEEGSARFRHSIEKFGMAGTVVLNKDLVLIDGNSRFKKAKENKLKKIWATVPDRLLTKKEFTEMAAMFDFAIAGTVDIDRIKNEVGTSEQFFKNWGLTMDKKVLDKLAELESNESKITPRAPGAKEEVKGNDIVRISLLFNASDADEYIRIAESLYRHFKTDNVTDLSLAAMRFLKKSLKLK